MIEFFDRIDFNKPITCHSGGADGSDTTFENECIERGILVKAYSYKTESHTSENKCEISDSDYEEGVKEVNKANKWMNRYGIGKYMNLLARNWCQVKYSDEIYAIGVIIDPGKRNDKGYYNKGQYQIVDGGTGYAVMMGINNERKVYVFDQKQCKWFKWSYTTMSFLECKSEPIITSNNFAGIGTRKINDDGIKAIRELFYRTFKK